MIAKLREIIVGLEGFPALLFRDDRQDETDVRMNAFADLVATGTDPTGICFGGVLTIEELGTVDIREVEEFTGVSRFLTHVTEMNHNLTRAQAIPDDISSALTYDRQQPRLYLLLRYEGTYHWMLYDIGHERLELVKDDQLLDMIACSSDTPPAVVDPNEVEIQAQRA